MKQNIIISGLHLSDNNRGSAALGYGAIEFLKLQNKLSEKNTLVNFRFYKNPFRASNRRPFVEQVNVGNVSIPHITYNIFFLQLIAARFFRIVFPFSRISKVLKDTSLIAAINGGDGFSDIYGETWFFNRLQEFFLARIYNIPLVILPQTLGPFKRKKNYLIAKHVLEYASRIYVRDDRFDEELKKMGLPFEHSKDLSFYMKPEPWNIEVKENAVGINVSGLAYSNKFKTLAGQFSMYPYLIESLIRAFQLRKIPVYLISHSYNYKNDDTNNDDIVASRSVYKRLNEKKGVYLIDHDLTSPQTKYVISKMNFFIGTRMHANFAAIYTGVPVYGLAYSYKFQGAFEANGIYDSTSMINNISKDEADVIVSKIIIKYKERNEKRT